MQNQRGGIGGTLDAGLLLLHAASLLRERHKLFAAGGMKSTARSNEVVVVRRGEAEQRLAFAINLDQVVDGTGLGQDVRLQPLDTVIVPRSDIAQVDLWVEQYIRNLLPATPSTSFIYSYNNTPSSTAAAASH